MIKKIIFLLCLYTLKAKFDIQELTKMNSNTREFKAFLIKTIKLESLTNSNSYFELITAYFQHCNKLKNIVDIDKEVNDIKNKIKSTYLEINFINKYLKNNQNEENIDLIKGLTFSLYYILLNKKEDTILIKEIFDDLNNQLNKEVNTHFESIENKLRSIWVFDDDLFNQIEILKKYLIDRQTNLKGICSYLKQLRIRLDKFEKYEENNFKELYQKEINFHFDIVKILYKIILKFDNNITPKNILENNLEYFYVSYYNEKKNSNNYFISFLKNLISLIENYKVNEEYNYLMENKDFSAVKNDNDDFITDASNSKFSFYSIIFYIVIRSKEYHNHHYSMDKKQFHNHKMTFQKKILLEYFDKIDVYSNEEKMKISIIFEPLFNYIHDEFKLNKKFSLNEFLGRISEFYYYYLIGNENPIKSEKGYIIIDIIKKFKKQFKPFDFIIIIQSFLFSTLSNLEFNSYSWSFIKFLIDYEDKTYLKLHKKDTGMEEKIDKYFFVNDTDRIDMYEKFYEIFFQDLDVEMEKFFDNFKNNEDHYNQNIKDFKLIKEYYLSFKFNRLETYVNRYFETKYDSKFNFKENILNKNSIKNLNKSEEVKDNLILVIDSFENKIKFEIKNILIYIINNLNKENSNHKNFLIQYKKILEDIGYNYRNKLYINIEYMINNCFN